MKKTVIDCWNGPVMVQDFCLIENPRKIEIRIGAEKRGKGRYAALTPRQASDLIAALQGALRDRLPEDPQRAEPVLTRLDVSNTPLH